MTTLTLRHQMNGKTLRWIVCIVLHDAKAAMTVAEIVAAVEALGYLIPGARAGKAVSDALRWEVRRGRVVQNKRGVYSAGLMQRSTEWSMRKRAEALKTSLPTSLVATTAAHSSGVAEPAAAIPPADGTAPAEATQEAASAEETYGGEFPALEAALAELREEARCASLVATSAAGSRFAAINIDDWVTPADDAGETPGWG